MAHEEADEAPPQVGGLLRRPAVVIRSEVLSALQRAGFADVLPAHLGVFQHPGPEGQHPSQLALRAVATKQAMNHLLHQLETTGYLTRVRDPADRRGRLVRLTERGWAADAVIKRTVARLDDQWRRQLGDDDYTSLATTLAALHQVLDRQESPR